MDDDYEEEYPGITPDQQEQMVNGLGSVRAVLGSEAGGGLSDKDIKDSLWYYYFDVEKTVEYLLDQQHKKNAAKEKAAVQKKQKAQSKAATPATTRPGTPVAGQAPVGAKKKAAPSGEAPSAATAKADDKKLSQAQQDMQNMGLADEDDVYVQEDAATLPTVSVAKEKILEDLKRQEREEGYKPTLSMVVVGHVDAGKSTLMGRMLAELGEMTEREVNNNQRQSDRMGKGSFAYAWAFDAMPEERARGVTIEIGIDSFATPHRKFTLIDAPGHRDFIPNMISGAAQADTALLVVDASRGGFESGFGEGGQTREHALLVRSFGVQQLVVAVNKLDAVGWDQTRYDEICAQLQPFLIQAGFKESRLTFIPCGAMTGENLIQRRTPELEAWYSGQTVIQRLDTLAVPERALEAPLRIPVANVFRGQTSGLSGLGVSGRIESGIVQVGERLAVLPGDETGVVKNIEVDGETVDYAVAGANVTLYLAAIDPIWVNVGCVLCEPSRPIPLASAIVAQIVAFELKFPLTAGSAIELFHHSKDTPGVIAKIEATLDKATGEVLKANPRMISKGASARVQIKLRPSGSSAKRSSIPIETFASSKSMGRVLLRRGGETVAAGIVLELLQ